MKNFEKIRVLRVITWLPLGGIEKRLLQTLTMLNKPPFEVKVCCIRERGILADKLEEAGIEVKLIPFKTRLDPFAIMKLAKYMREEKFDIVHSHMYRSNVPAAIAAKIAGVPVVLSQVHNVDTWESIRQRIMDKLLCSFRDGVIAVSGEVKKDVLKNLKVKDEFCKVIYNGVDIEKFDQTQSNRTVFRDHKIKDTDIVITMVTRLVRQKNPDIAMKAFMKVMNRFPNAHLVFAGYGKMQEELLKMSVENNLTERVHFLGMRNDIPEILKASDIFILPSSKEGFSNAIIEAMAAGLPVIVSNVGGNAEAVRDNVDGFIIRHEDENILAEKMEILLSDKTRRFEMGRSAHERAKVFSMDSMIKNVSDYYKECLGRKI